MKQYPEIPGGKKAPLGKPCIAFYKYDGSNLRWEWSSKKGWYKFGTRTRLFNETDPIFAPAIPLFMETMADELVERFKDIEKGISSAIVFTEYFGIQSFAGGHVEDDPKYLKLFDVNLYKRGIMAPRQFVKNFGFLPYAAKVVYDGTLNKSFIDDVRNGRYQVDEGVVAKGDSFMVKIKTLAYLDKLKQFNKDIAVYVE